MRLKQNIIKNIKLLQIKEIKSSYNETCHDNSQCKSYLNLVCTNKICLCPSPATQYWNGTYCGKSHLNLINNLHIYLKLILK